jgi:hypothetical protein
MGHGKIPCACRLPDQGAASIGSPHWRQLAAIGESLPPCLDIPFGPTVAVNEWPLAMAVQENLKKNMDGKNENED